MAWMAWDHWLARNGLRAVDWEPGEEYVRIDAWAEAFEYAGYELEDNRLELPEYAPLVPILTEVAEMQRTWDENEAVLTGLPQGRRPGARKVLINDRGHAETVWQIISVTREPRTVAELLGISHKSLYDAFAAHDLGQPCSYPGGRKRAG